MLTVPDGLTYTALEAWARLTDRSPSPIEVETLLRLDFITRSPDAGGHDDAAEV